jgi:hypothetical protein
MTATRAPGQEQHARLDRGVAEQRCVNTGTMKTVANRANPRTNVRLARSPASGSAGRAGPRRDARRELPHDERDRATAATTARTTMYRVENQSSVSPRSRTVCSDPRPATRSPIPIQSIVSALRAWPAPSRRSHERRRRRARSAG